MPPVRKVGVVVGSLRKESFTRKVANAIVALAPPSLQFEFVDIAQISPYNQDLEDSPPPDWVALRQKISAVDAVLFATPEYNRSVPGVLKNAIDVASRPYGKSAWNGKPGAVVSVSPGVIGGFGANHHLRQMLVFLNVPTMQQPEAYIGGAAKLFDQSGNLENDSTRDFLPAFVNAFAAWIDLNLGGRNPQS
ncbi:MAG: NADPH-dependent FMN reductase [Gemmatimonadaceae bacterium]